MGDTVHEVIEKFLRDGTLKYHGGFSVIEGLLLGYARDVKTRDGNQPSEFAFLFQICGSNACIFSGVPGSEGFPLLGK